jgi:hypothetical protein
MASVFMQASLNRRGFAEKYLHTVSRSMRNSLKSTLFPASACPGALPGEPRSAYGRSSQVDAEISMSGAS